LAKGPEAFRTISEAAEEVGVPQHVLRFWETKFTFIRPMKRAGGRRFYRPSDLAVLRGVRTLLHEDGYTIKGVQKLHRDEGVGRVSAASEKPRGKSRSPVSAAVEVSESSLDRPGGLDSGARERLAAALEALESAKARLDDALNSG
jgi:DNA-binding transcriptional MerR regulator